MVSSPSAISLPQQSHILTSSLPGRKELLKSDAEYEVILVDATETPVERPQKNKENTIQERKKDIR